MSTDPEPPRPALFLLAAALIGAIVFVRVIALGSDAPGFLSWSPGIYSDEGFYSGDARSEVLFHQIAIGGFHSALLSPPLHAVQLVVFHLFGVGLVQARSISVALGLISIAVFSLALRRLYGDTAGVLSALFLGLSAPFVLYNRLALVETPAVCLLTVGFLLAATPKRWFWVGLATGTASIIKPLALLAAPAFVLEALRSSRRDAALALLGIALPAALYMIAWYLPHHDMLAHMGSYYAGGQYLPPGRGDLLQNLRHRLLMGAGDDVLPYLWRMAPLLSLLAIAGACVAAREKKPGDILLVTWLIVAPLAFLCVSYTPSRYYVIFWPALAGLAARGVAYVAGQASRKKPAQLAFLTCVIALFLVSNGWQLGKAWEGRRYDLHAGSQALAQSLPAGSILAGQMAPALCLDNRFQALMVQPHLANDKNTVERYQVSYVLVTRSVFWNGWWSARYPQIIQPGRIVATLRIGRYLVDVYQVNKQ